MRSERNICEPGSTCAMAILAMPEHGRDARGTSQENGAARKPPLHFVVLSTGFSYE
jgi:hypothetical protein